MNTSWNKLLLYQSSADRDFGLKIVLQNESAKANLLILHTFYFIVDLKKITVIKMRLSVIS